MIVDSDFRPPWWLKNTHLQTLWPVLFRRRRPPALRRERLELPDGDFLDLDWTPDQQGPLVVVFHGLEGSIRSHYAAGIMQALMGAGHSALLMHFRGCSGEPNRLARSYNMGDTGDMAHVIDMIKQRYPGRPVFAVGFSLGGNALLKWLGETGEHNPLSAAAAISIPFDLFDAARRLDQGVSRVYQWYLLRKLKESMRRKQRLRGLNHDLPDLRTLKNFPDFDDAVTAPLHGYQGVDDYYTRASSRQYLGAIRRPTLIIHAWDDPFMSPSGVPEAAELSQSITLELARHGGHVGFVAAARPPQGVSWLERRILRWLAEQAVDTST